MDAFSLFLQDRLALLGASPRAAAAYAFLFALLCLALFSGLCGWLCRRLLVPFVLRLVARTETKLDDYFLNFKVLNAVCRLLPGCLFYLLLPLACAGPHRTAFPKAYGLVGTAAEVYIVEIGRAHV